VDYQVSILEFKLRHSLKLDDEEALVRFNEFVINIVLFRSKITKIIFSSQCKLKRSMKWPKLYMMKRWLVFLMRSTKRE